MHFVQIIAISILLYSFTFGYTIISIDTFDDENAIDTDTLTGYFGSDMHEPRIAEIHHENGVDIIGKSNRFYYSNGERVIGDSLLQNVFKQTNSKNKQNQQVNVTYQTEHNETLTYVMMIVYQESLINRIHIIDGGINSTKISINVAADQSRYLAYNVSYFGIPPK